MIIVIGQFRIPATQIDAAMPAMRRVIEGSLKETGCRAYAYAQDISEVGLFRVHEEWDSREALDRHFSAPHMLEWQQVRESLGFHDRHVAAFEAGQREQL